MHKKILPVALALAFVSAPAQTEIFKPNNPSTLFTADTLYIGAGLLYPGGAPVIATLVKCESITKGKLYAINPAGNDTVFVFNNMDVPGTAVDVSSLTTLPKDGALYFMYVPENTGSPKFTGPNRIGDRYYSPESSDSNLKPNLRFGHRWSVIGRTKSGDIEIGFEDWVGPQSDMDFNDLIFHVSGLKITAFRRLVRDRDMVR